ncbi:ABC transporter ATP-binding protein [Anatilimnocola floriformis]|uniref:ABC transporter ATP-binding protein n=1 Tax=Anatilimnocola floriformis TaxID=2948575 RepID=UPI0020C323B2|nr:ABC transporter ATP-binding protein [Anatilimnocola floriformis]
MSEPVIDIRGLTRQFGNKAALHDVSLTVPRGCVFGLVGENGAGKTTLIKHVLGLLRAQVGSVQVFGRNPVEDPVGVLGRIGCLSEDRDLPDWMRIAEMLRYMQAFYPTWDEQFAEELCKRFEIQPRQKVATLSRGQRARAGLVTALAHRPELLVLDEPSSGLDPVVRQDILGAIVRTVADEGRTVLFSSHLLDEVERVSDHVAFVHGGRIVVSDTLDQIKTSHRRMTVRFPQPQYTPPQLPGALQCVGEGLEWTFLANGGSEELKRAVAEQGGTVIEETVPSLEEIFVSRVK